MADENFRQDDASGRLPAAGHESGRHATSGPDDGYPPGDGYDADGPEPGEQAGSRRRTSAMVLGAVVVVLVLIVASVAAVNARGDDGGDEGGSDPVAAAPTTATGSVAPSSLPGPGASALPKVVPPASGTTATTAPSAVGGGYTRVPDDPAAPEAVSPEAGDPEAAPAVPPAQAPAGTAPLSAAQVQGMLEAGLAQPNPDDLEGGERAVPTIREVGANLKTVPLYEWRIGDPVTVDGEGVMHAPFETRLRNEPEFHRAELTFVDRDNRWRLSNQSVCFLAHRAYAQCTV